VRERFFTPRLRFKNLDELNAWLLDRCIAYTKAHKHPEFADKTIWEVFEAEPPSRSSRSLAVTHRLAAAGNTTVQTNRAQSAASYPMAAFACTMRTSSISTTASAGARLSSSPAEGSHFWGETGLAGVCHALGAQSASRI
jgi:hypothetical protein